MNEQNPLYSEINMEIDTIEDQSQIEVTDREISDLEIEEIIYNISL